MSKETTRMPWHLRALLQVRPAPLNALFARLAGAHRRREVESTEGRFWVAPLTRLGRSLIYGVGYEPSMCAVLRRYLQRGSVFVDLGANEGFFSVAGSRLVGSSGRVIAVEPQVRLQPVIRRHLDLNGCCNVQVVRAAVAGKAGPVDLFLTSNVNSGASSLYRPTRYRVPHEQVRGVTLEDLFSECSIERCDLMKVDVEGAELQILAGALRLLRLGRIRNIAVDIHNEILARQGLNGREVMDILRSCGYLLNSDLGNWVFEHSGEPSEVGAPPDNGVQS